MGFRQHLLYVLFRALSALACLLPRRVALALGTGFAQALWSTYRLTPYRDFVADNVRAAFPELDPCAANRVGRAHVVNLVKAIVEVLRFPRLDRRAVERLVTVEGMGHLEEALAAGRGVMIMTAHFGNWELLGATLSRLGHPLAVLVQPPSQAAFDRLFLEFRALVGIASHPNRGPASLRPMFRHLRANGLLGLICDQHGEGMTAFGTLFGHRISVPSGPFFFAERTGAAILPMSIVRTPRDRHVLRIEAPIVPTGDPDRDAQQLCDRFEAWIRAHPDHWLWVHARFDRADELPVADPA